MNIQDITTLGQLKASGYKLQSVKEEVRNNLIKKINQNEPSFNKIVGYNDTVIPETERALLSRHNILFLGLRGQAKTRMARQMIDLLDDFIPIVKDSPINDHPLKPISKYAKSMIANLGDNTPIEWLHKSQRYGEKLATPDVSVSDLIGDIDPIKAANLKLTFADEEVIHYGIIPRSNRGIFVINELPDLQARIQVSLFNILEEGDIQIRGFKLQLPLDILFVFTANPEDYTNRGSIVTPLKDRIQSQILTHYPKTIEDSLVITEQEANILPEQTNNIHISYLMKQLIEQIAFEARNSEYVDKKSGVSARLTISAYENLMSTAERRLLQNREAKTQVWVSDILGVVPSLTGKIELVYEGEQEGPYQVAIHLIDKAIRTLFVQYFPDPETYKKKKYTNKKSMEEKPLDNPYKQITDWFNAGNQIDLLQSDTDAKKLSKLNTVKGLKQFVTQFYNTATPDETALLMELTLHGLAAYSFISKQQLDGKLQFKDLMGSMMNLNALAADDDFDE